MAQAPFPHPTGGQPIMNMRGPLEPQAMRAALLQALQQRGLGAPMQDGAGAGLMAQQHPLLNLRRRMQGDYGA